MKKKENVIKVDTNNYTLPSRWLYKLTDKIFENGKNSIQQGILISAIQSLDPALHRDALRAIIKVVYSSGNTPTASRLSKTIVKGSDYIAGFR